METQGKDGLALDEFIKFTLADDLKTYFTTHSDYDLILPGIDQTDYINKIVDKTYLVDILNDKSIMLYKNDGKPLNTDNVIFCFKPVFDAGK